MGEVMFMPHYSAQEEAVCGGCVHFRRHYIKIGKIGDCYRPIAYGHCVYPRSKKRTQSDTCPNWTPKT